MKKIISFITVLLLVVFLPANSFSGEPSKAHANEQIDKLTIQINDLEVTDTAFEKYARYGMSLLKDLTWYFQEAEPQAKKKLLGSIFPAKLIFKDGNYRTSALNPALPTELSGQLERCHKMLAYHLI